MNKTILRKWLKAGFIDKHVLYATEEGTPQGGICSPVIANMAGRLFGRIGTVASMRP